MRSLGTLAGVLALVCGLGVARAQIAVPGCSGALVDCLLSEAEAVAESVARSGQRDEVHFSIAAARAQLGRADSALDVAARIENSHTLAAALGQISGAAARAGNFDLAYEIALDIVDARIQSARVAALEALAVQQAAAGKIDAAFDTVIAIDNPFRRSEAQAAIAITVARSGEIAQAIRTASKIATNYWFTSDQHRFKVASGLVSRSDEFDQYWFHESLARIAQIQALDGDILGALQTAKSIPDAGGRSRATALIASVQAGNGDVVGALATARRIEAPYGDLDALIAIAGVQAVSGNFAEALKLAHDIARSYGDTSALGTVAVQQARRGLVRDGLKTAAGIDNLESRTKALAGISDALVRNGEAEAALEVAAMIPDARDRSDAIRQIAVVLVQAGDPKRALDVAVDHAALRDRDEVVVAIVLAQAAAGDTGGAIATALQLEDDMLRGVALAGIAPYVR